MAQRRHDVHGQAVFIFAAAKRFPINGEALRQCSVTFAIRHPRLNTLCEFAWVNFVHDKPKSRMARRTVAPSFLVATHPECLELALA